MSTPSRKCYEFPTPTQDTVGDRLRARRLQLGFTQAALAEAIGVSERAVQKYEDNGTAIRTSLLVQLARLGFDIDLLVFGVNHPELSEADKELWDRVVAWGDESLVDEKNRPHSDYFRYQLMAKFFRWLKGGEQA
ncbi:MAG: XRE family transcriptional regulator [Nevskiaceae bacterium]|nr:MAG: XRE family transcriptional regulator [Nevskiaceae bacterium]